MTAAAPLTTGVDHVKGSRSFYQTPDGVAVGVTTALSVIAKPALLNWMGYEERKWCIEIAAQLWQDAPLNKEKMSKLAFIQSLEYRLGKQLAGNNAKNRAGNIGTEAHHLIQWQTTKDLGLPAGKQPEVSPPALVAYNDWLRFRDMVEMEPVWCEQKVYSRTHGYAGTLDQYCKILFPEKYEDCLQVFGKIDGDLFEKCAGQILLATSDYKTGRRIYDEAYFQIAAYGKALAEMGHGLTDVGLVLRLPKVEGDGFEVGACFDLDAKFRTFLCALALWKEVNPEEAAKITVNRRAA